MKMKMLPYITILVLGFFSLTSFGQTIKKQALINEALKDSTIQVQFEVLIENSPSFQQFKNIKSHNLSKYKANFLDSLKTFDKKYLIANTEIAKQRKEIELLKSKIEGINTDLTSVNEEKNNINLFGMQTTKTIYNTILWSIILGLLATAVVFFLRFKSSNSQTKNAKNLFCSVEEEFETHKKKSLEREQILRRKLQDEINKQRNI